MKELLDKILFLILFFFSWEFFIVWSFKSAFIAKGEKTNGIVIDLIICENHKVIS